MARRQLCARSRSTSRWAALTARWPPTTRCGRGCRRSRRWRPTRPSTTVGTPAWPPSARSCPSCSRGRASRRPSPPGTHSPTRCAGAPRPAPCRSPALVVGAPPASGLRHARGAGARLAGRPWRPRPRSRRWSCASSPGWPIATRRARRAGPRHVAAGRKPLVGGAMGLEARSRTSIRVCARRCAPCSRSWWRRWAGGGAVGCGAELAGVHKLMAANGAMRQRAAGGPRRRRRLARGGLRARGEYARAGTG